MFDRQWMIDRDERITREMREREDRRDREARDRHHHELVVFGFILGGLTLLGSLIEAGWIGKP